eukprot:5314137-Lingulodinium_polyedra.AAC.1
MLPLVKACVGEFRRVAKGVPVGTVFHIATAFAGVAGRTDYCMLAHYRGSGPCLTILGPCDELAPLQLDMRKRAGNAMSHFQIDMTLVGAIF